MPKSAAELFPDDCAVWRRLIPKVAEYNHELADLLIYVRSCKGELKPSRKWGYVLVTEQFDEKNQNIYNETIRPKLAKHQEKFMEILRNLV